VSANVVCACLFESSKGASMFRLASRPLLDLKKRTWIVSILFATCCAVPGWAGTILELQIGSGGTVTYGIGSHHRPIHGRGIRVSDLRCGAGIMPILMGRLVFNGGSFVGSHAGNWFWGPGGNLSVRGCVDLNQDAKCNKGDFKGTLATGSFLSAQVVERKGKEVLIAHIVDQLNPQLAALLNLPDTSYTGVLQLVLVRLEGCNSRWIVRDGVQGGFLSNSSAVAEPSSIVLLGASLASLAILRRRRAFL